MRRLRPPPSLWKCGNPALFAGFPSPVERVENSLWFFEFPPFPRGVISTAIFSPFPPARGVVREHRPRTRRSCCWHKGGPGMFFSQEVKQ